MLAVFIYSFMAEGVSVYVVVSLRNPLANCLWVTRGEGHLEPSLNKDKFDQNRWYMSKVRKVGQLYELQYTTKKIGIVIRLLYIKA